MTTRRAFSLVELLVVISLITLLIAMLLPALGRARRHGQGVVCLNNMRSIMTATLQYADDGDQYLPFPNWGGNAIDVGGWTYGGWLYKNTGPALTLDPQWNFALLQTGVIYPYLSSQDIYRCPNDTLPYARQCGQITSYNMNGSVCGFGEAKTFRTFDFKKTDSVIYWEVDETGAPGWWWDGGNFPSEGISVTRHYEGATMVSIDNHIEFITQIDYYALAASSPGRLWNAPDTTNGH